MQNATANADGACSDDDFNHCLELCDNAVGTLKAAVAAFREEDEQKAEKLFEASREELAIAIRDAVQRLGASRSGSVVMNKLNGLGERVHQILSAANTAVRSTLVDAMSSALTYMDESLWRSAGPTWNADVLMELRDTSVFLVSNGGNHVQPLVHNTLQVCTFRSDSADAVPDGCSPAFLSIGDWYYPLVAGAIVMYQSGINAFLFPSPESNGPAIGVVLSEAEMQTQFTVMLQRLGMNLVDGEPGQSSQLGAAMSAREHIATNPCATSPAAIAAHSAGLMASMTAARSHQSATSPIAARLNEVSEWIGSTVLQGAAMASELLHKQGDVVRAKLPSSVEPTAVVHPVAASGMRALRKASHAIATYSSMMVDAMSVATGELSRRLAPSVYRVLPYLMPAAMMNALERATPTGRTVSNEIAQMAASGLRGASVIYHQMEQAARTLGRTLATEAVKTVAQVYGAQTGRLAEDAVYTVGNVAMAASDLQNAGMKAVAGQLARDVRTTPSVDCGLQRQRRSDSTSV